MLKASNSTKQHEMRLQIMEVKIFKLTQVIENRKVNEAIQEQMDKKSKMYEGDFRRFQAYASTNNMPLDFSTLEAYLLHTIESGLKLSTFNRRCASVKHYLINEYGIAETTEQNKRIALLRQKFNDKEHVEQKRIQGQSAQPKHEVMDLINKLDTRAKAIALFNLITACRPSEMVSVKIGNIDFKSRSVSIYLKKQKEWTTKRLTLEVVKAIQDYVKAYGLDEDSYLVGKVDRHGNYTNAEVTEVAYRKTIHKWLGFAPYTLRKTQITAMHENGADIATIAKQSGHKNLQTISKHYLEVNNTTVDKYL